MNSSPGMGVRMKRIDEYFTRKQPTTGVASESATKKAKRGKKTPKTDKKGEQDEVCILNSL